VRRRGRKLLATKRAGGLTPGARRVRILESLLDGDSFLAAVTELTLAALAQGARDARARVAEAIDDAGWRSDGGPLPSHAVPSTMTDVRRVLLAIGAAEGDPRSRAECALTEPWRAAVLCALRAQALRPQPLPPAPPDPPPPPELLLERAGVALPPVPGGTPSALEPADEDDRAELIRLAHPKLAAAIDGGEKVVVIDGEAVNPRLHLLIHQVVADRLLHGEPPEDWLAFDALLAHGVDAHEAQHAIGRRLVEELVAEFGPPPAPARRTRERGDRRASERRKAQRAARRRNRR
jgi:hypothetical protein